LRLAVGQTMPDIIAPHLKVLFCGITPASIRLWWSSFRAAWQPFLAALYAGGWTPRRFWPHEDAQMLDFGMGIPMLCALHRSRLPI
jgi:TDG/mug DNA glycosylase family protein